MVNGITLTKAANYHLNNGLIELGIQFDDSGIAYAIVENDHEEKFSDYMRY
jgi:hypothetical protein